MVIIPSTFACKNYRPSTKNQVKDELKRFWAVNPVFSEKAYVSSFSSLNIIKLILFLLFISYNDRIKDHFKNKLRHYHFHWRRVIADEGHEYIRNGKGMCLCISLHMFILLILFFSENL